MADRAAEVSVITLGGKGSSLSSSCVYAIANGLAKVRIDSSALDRLASSSNDAPLLQRHQFTFPDLLTLEECRASFVVLLNKLLLLSGSAGIRTDLPVHIAEALNSGLKTIRFGSLDLTEQEVLALETLKVPSVLYGISALSDHQSAALSTVVDVAAALSCEASKADVSVFNSMDSGDGYAEKEEVGVASDVKVLLTGSNLVGKVEIEAVSNIPKIHGCLREQAKSVHSKTRVDLNSVLGVGKGGPQIAAVAEALQIKLHPLAAALRNLGNSSLSHAKLNLDAVSVDDLRSSLVSLFNEKCPSGNSLRSGYKVVCQLVSEEEENYVLFAKQVYVLLGIVWKIVAWEVITAYIALEGAKLNEKSEGAEINGGGDVKVERKREKKKKKKEASLKGTRAIVQEIKERLESKEEDAIDNLGLSHKWIDSFLSLLDPKDPDFDGLLNKIKEIVESNETRRLPKIPKGTRDFAKEQMAIRKKAFSTIEEVFERHGATALDTPAFELRETLMGKYGEDSKLIYDLADQGGELCSLRYDLTVPFARYVAMNGFSSFKRYQIGKVYRRDNPSKGRFREFYQCDFDIAGQYEHMGPDFEIVKILTELLDELSIGDYEIKLNHRLLLDGMLEICGVPPEKFRTICSSIDKLDKQKFEEIKREMVDEKGLTVETADRIGTYVKERGSPLVLLNALKQEDREFIKNQASKKALDDLEILFKALEKSKCIDKVVFDLSLARGLDYYTGMIFEAVFIGGTQVGSIAAGGRYDNLIKMFGGKEVPAVGVSLGIERVFTIMELQLKKQKIRATKTEVLVSILGDDLLEAAELASLMWNAGIKAEYLVNKRISKHFDRATESGIPWMIIVRERERKEGIVKLRDLSTKSEEDIPRSRIVEELRKRLSLNP